LSPGLAHGPEPDPGQLPPERPRTLDDPRRDPTPERSRPLRALGPRSEDRPRCQLPRREVERPLPGHGRRRPLGHSPPSAARRTPPWAMGQRLRKLGIRLAETRSTALFQLATELPAAVLARTLGIHITVAVKWQRAAAGDWAAYAADVSNRTRKAPAP